MKRKVDLKLIIKITIVALVLFILFFWTPLNIVADLGLLFADNVIHSVVHQSKETEITDLDKRCFSGFQCQSGTCYLDSPSLVISGIGRCGYSMEIGCNREMHFGLSISPGFCIDPAF